MFFKQKYLVNWALTVSLKYQLPTELMVAHFQYISDEVVIEGGYHYKLLVIA